MLSILPWAYDAESAVSADLGYIMPARKKRGYLISCPVTLKKTVSKWVSECVL
jgi:hypothetical protein